jgi:hypothetical protein
MNEGKKMIDCRDESSESKLDNECKLKQFERNTYFYGKLMTVGDFQLEQSYFTEKRHIINRLIHGVGVVCGLEVSEIKKIGEKCVCGPEGEIRTVGEKWAAVLSAGSALDCIGHEIIVSKSDTWSISDIKEPEKLPSKFGLYMKRKDISKNPVPSPSITSSCEEVCCYSRIEENFELVFDVLPEIAQLTFDSPSYSVCDSATIILIEPKGDSTEDTRKVKLNYVADPLAGQPIVSTDKELTPKKFLNPKIELPAADVFTADIDLKPEFYKQGGLLVVEYELNAAQKLSSTAYIQEQKAARSDLYPKLEKKKVADDYYKHWLKECTCCVDPRDPKVLLAVLSKVENDLRIEEELTTWYRNIVYNNPMLYDLISCHITHKNNPHEVTAEQVRALKTINHLGNKDTNTCHVSNIDLVAGDGINISPIGNETIKIAATSGSGFRATSGLIRFRDISAGTFLITESYEHHASGDSVTPPAIILSEESDDESDTMNTIKYMEDLVLMPLLYKFSGIAEPQSKEEFGDFFNVEAPLIFFKAIRVTPKQFSILLINFARSPGANKRRLNIRWHAIPAITVTRIEPVFRTNKLVYEKNDDVQITIIDSAASHNPTEVDSVSGIKVFSESDTVGRVLSAIETNVNTDKFTLSFSLDESRNTGIHAEDGDNVTIEYPDVLDPQRKFTFFFTVGMAKGDTSIINISTVKFKDLEGNDLNKLTINKDALISTMVKNTKNVPQPFLTYISVKDSSGKIVSAQRQSGNLSPGVETNITVTWKPEVAGEYKVKIIVVDPESKAMLSSVSESTVKAS